MNNELTLNIQQIVVKQGSIEFSEYEAIKKQALHLASQIETVEVSEDNIKQSKQLLAAVNKRIKELEDKRISIKKHMLEPYQEFELQVKEIVTIVKDADDTVRQQVKELEEAERREKESTIQQIFEKRLQHYSFKNLFGFRDFLKPKHLNKSTSIKAVEEEMVSFLEKLSTDLNVIESLPNSEDVLNAYVETKDISVALSVVNQQEERKRMIKAAQPKKSANTFFIRVFDEKDLKLVKMFMEQNQIKYEVG